MASRAREADSAWEFTHNAHSFMHANGMPSHHDVILFHILPIRVRMRRDFLNRLIEKYFEQLIDSVRVLRPH